MLCVHNITGIYEKQDFYLPYERIMLNDTSLEGVRGYMSDETRVHILNEIKSNINGIHFLDSGNFHHISRLYLEFIKETSFNLIVYDNHTDMQLSTFGNILSCGSWIADAYLTLKNINEIYIIGANHSYIKDCDFKSDKNIHFLKSIKDADLTALPVYISVDKDVLSTSEFNADWDQGSMSLKTLLNELEKIKMNHTVIGVDVCGEPLPENVSDIKNSNKINREILNIFSNILT